MSLISIITFRNAVTYFTFQFKVLALKKVGHFAILMRNKNLFNFMNSFSRPHLYQIVMVLDIRTFNENYKIKYIYKNTNNCFVLTTQLGIGILLMSSSLIYCDKPFICRMQPFLTIRLVYLSNFQIWSRCSKILHKWRRYSCVLCR